MAGTQVRAPGWSDNGGTITREERPTGYSQAVIDRCKADSASSCHWPIYDDDGDRLEEQLEIITSPRTLAFKISGVLMVLGLAAARLSPWALGCNVVPDMEVALCAPSHCCLSGYLTASGSIVREIRSGVSVTQGSKRAGRSSLWQPYDRERREGARIRAPIPSHLRVGMLIRGQGENIPRNPLVPGVDKMMRFTSFRSDSTLALLTYPLHLLPPISRLSRFSFYQSLSPPN